MQISLLGCGWLGRPLSKAMLEKGYTVKASTTTTTKLSSIEALGISPFLVELGHTSVHSEAEIDAFLKGSNCLIISIPPQGRTLGVETQSGKNFVEKIQGLIPFIEQARIENVLLLSSISVYGQIEGTITEETLPRAHTESGRQLLEAERLLQQNPNFNSSIIRFGGLVGEDRNPIHTLTGKKNLENPHSPINLIDQSDCIGIIMDIIGQNVWNQIFNAVAPYHPTRAQYYTQKATALKLAIPEFDYSKPSISKIIMSKKVETLLHYHFKKPLLH